MSPQERAPLSAADPIFGPNTQFSAELRRRVDEFFAASGRRRRDCPLMHLKSAVLLLGLAGAYVCLVFLAEQGWQALALSIVVGLLVVGIGFNVQHDGSHSAYSNSPLVNRLSAMTFDLIGFSSYYWRVGHAVLHHKFTNVAGLDTDFDFGVFARKAPSQRLLAHHRWQHYYIWLLYGLYMIEWSLVHDFRNFVTGKFYDRPCPRPRGAELVIFMVGKALFLIVAFVIPLQFHSLWTVLACFVVAAFTAGVVRAVACVLAHEVEGVGFPAVNGGRTVIAQEWTKHQVESTVNYRCSRLVSEYLGGLNYQIEHHLFPTVSHVNYRFIAPLVREVCREFGVEYKEHRSIAAGLISHYRWLRRLGMPEAIVGSDRAKPREA